VTLLELGGSQYVAYVRSMDWPSSIGVDDLAGCSFGERLPNLARDSHVKLLKYLRADGTCTRSPEFQEKGSGGRVLLAGVGIV
jgi:hypothetical protein